MSNPEPPNLSTLKDLLLLEARALAGLVLPALAWHLDGVPLSLNRVGAVVIGLAWWFTPGLPVPLIHSFTRGWLPFALAYPLGLRLILDARLEDRNSGVVPAREE